MRDLAFDDMHLFARVAERGTLSAVARERDVPVSQVSRHLARIEQACGTPLVLRSTHGLSLTEEGRVFLGYCQRLLGTLDDLEGEFGASGDGVAGRVRVATSPAMAHYLLIPSLAGLSQRHPQLAVELLSEDRLIDLVREGTDIAIRSGATGTDGVFARTLGHTGRRLYASPGYLAQHGRPERVEDLARHRLVTNSVATHLNRWPFIVEGQPLEWPAQGHYCANSSGVMLTMLLCDLGIGRSNTLIAAPLVEQGRLVPVLESLVDVQRFPIYAMTLPGRQRLPKVRACLDWWAQWFSRHEEAGA